MEVVCSRPAAFLQILPIIDLLHSGTLPARKLYCVMIPYIVPVCMVIILLSSFLLDL